MLSWLELLIGRYYCIQLIVCIIYINDCTVKQISDNEIYLLITYTKSVLWRVAKRLSYIEDARCLKVNLSCTRRCSVSPVQPNAGVPLLKAVRIISERANKHSCLCYTKQRFPPDQQWRNSTLCRRNMVAHCVVQSTITSRRSAALRDALLLVVGMCM